MNVIQECIIQVSQEIKDTIGLENATIANIIGEAEINIVPTSFTRQYKVTAGRA